MVPRDLDPPVRHRVRPRRERRRRASQALGPRTVRGRTDGRAAGSLRARRRTVGIAPGRTPRSARGSRLALGAARRARDRARVAPRRRRSGRAGSGPPCSSTAGVVLGIRHCRGPDPRDRGQQQPPRGPVHVRRRRHPEAPRPHLPIRPRGAVGRRGDPADLGRSRADRRLLRPAAPDQRVPRLHRPHADRLSGATAPLPTRAGVPARHGPGARRVFFPSPAADTRRGSSGQHPAPRREPPWAR